MFPLNAYIMLSRSGRGLPNMTKWVTDNRKIGIGLTTFGVVFLLLGVVLLFDRALLALGNMLFICGITLLIGTHRTVKFFMSPTKVRGTACFAIGILLVLVGWPVVGMVFESFGIVNLFGNFFPIILAFLRRLPGCSVILSLPYVGRCLDRLAGESYLIGEE